MEYTRSIKINYEHDTNKNTTNEEFDNVLDAVEFLFGLLDDDEKLGVVANFHLTKEQRCGILVVDAINPADESLTHQELRSVLTKIYGEETYCKSKSY